MKDTSRLRRRRHRPSHRRQRRAQAQAPCNRTLRCAMASSTNSPQAAAMQPGVVSSRRRSLAGPLVLITMGVLFLLANTGVITWSRLDYSFWRCWPVLIILWGVVKLIEYMRARSEGRPAPGIGLGGALFLFFIIMLGLTSSGIHHWAPYWKSQIGDEPFWGWNSYDFSE